MRGSIGGKSAEQVAIIPILDAYTMDKCSLIKAAVGAFMAGCVTHKIWMILRTVRTTVP